MTQLTVDKLSVRVSSEFKLSNITSTIRPGSLTGIIGPNGSGKSTLAKCLVGLLPTNDGQITIDNTPLAEMGHSERAQKIGYLPQQARVAWRIFVAEAIRLGAMHTRRGKENPDYLAKVMNQCGISHLADRDVAKLSGGEQMRVHLARVFYGQHHLIVADEPCASLDIEHQHRIMTALKDHSRKRTTVVIIHDLALAQKYCDRLLLMDQGRLRLDDESDTVLRSEVCSEIFQVRFDEYIHQGEAEAKTALLIPQPKD
ncbi:MAG: ABC transporter ATP-binding protein [Gammaproteobacteria bacterium]